jgi:hypothetical protein
LFGTIVDFHDGIAGANFTFLQHAEVKPWSVVGNKQGWHPRLVHANADAVARYARLCHLEYRITNAVSITNADLVIGKSFNGKVLAELAENEIIASKKALPIIVGLHLVDKYGTLLPTMTGEIRLRIAIDIQLAHHPALFNGKFPDRCSHSFAVPCHFIRKADI